MEASGGMSTPNKEYPAAQQLKEAMSDPVLNNRKWTTKANKMPIVHSLPSLGLDVVPCWPNSVVDLLKSAPKRSSAPADSEGLCLCCGSFQIPHPRKAASGGEDSLFLCPSGAAAGIADGVGEWEWRFGLNPRAFADELMQGAASAVATTKTLSAKDRAMNLLEVGYASTKSFGSSTGIIVAMDVANAKLGVANIGDSGLRQLRRSANSKSDVVRVVGRTADQQHSFNCPFQLSRLPKPSDFARLRQEGKEKLVRAVEKTPASKQDLPQDADLYALDVQEGDMILIGSDGVFDNLHDHEICDLFSMAAQNADPNDVARAVAQAARDRSQDTTAKTPFSQNATEAGLYHVGGKLDDVTVIAAWVVQPV